ncbi:hypothetical protein [Streptomyces sp. NPDC056255]|uniref:hypothetical protein n=1 Tax=Streptomyces sp. NPDC056255 TaxID=3345764 RepID=UPI0035DF6CC8
MTSTDDVFGKGTFSAVVVLTLTGHLAAATAVAVLGGGTSAVGGIQATASIRR